MLAAITVGMFIYFGYFDKTNNKFVDTKFEDIK